MVKEQDHGEAVACCTLTLNCATACSYVIGRKFMNETMVAFKMDVVGY